MSTKKKKITNIDTYTKIFWVRYQKALRDYGVEIPTQPLSSLKTDHKYAIETALMVVLNLRESELKDYIKDIEERRKTAQNSLS